MDSIRQLSAILFTDLVGFSALMGRDESEAIAILDKSREIQKPLVEEYGGRWIKELGDGAIIIFTSVLSALECAMKIQMEVREIDHLKIKMALHSGEIILKNGDVFGDGVNVAARMEQLGQADSILLSESAQREIRNINSIETVPLGRFSFKNIEEPIHLFAVSHPDLRIPDLKASPLRVSEADKPVAPRSVDQEFEERLLSLIRDNLSSESLTVAFLCKEMGVSRPQLYRKAQALTGQSPSDLIRKIRLEKAAELLKANTGNVSEVAYETGFNNLSYFSKAFQERYGLAPSAFAKKHQQGSKVVIPTALNRFIGREKEIAEITELLDQARLLTLTGTGGTGKTRLVIELLRRISTRFRDGAYFVPLAPVGVPEQVLSKVSQVLKVQQDPTKRTRDALIEYFQEKELLLVLDNFEHVLPAAKSIRSILEACPKLKIIVTSRVVLNLAGEFEYAVPQLPVPDASRDYTVEEMGAFHAVEFFLNRVQEVKPNFKLTEKNKIWVQEICRTLDGLPLGLELAAARMKIFSPEALLKRLSRNLDILKSNSPDLPPRHQSLVNAIDWSYGLLSPQEQTLFRRLSIFSGGFTLEAAEQVCFRDYAGQEDLVDSIGNLLDKSLVQQQDQPDGEPRFFLLETIKSFGQSRLKRSLEFDEIVGNYYRYYQNRLEDANKGLTGPDMIQWINYIELELDNLRSIFLWLEQQQKAEKGLAFAISFWRYWPIRSMMREGANWLQRMLEIAPTKKESILRCKVLNAYGVLFGITRRIMHVRSIFQESLQMARNLDYKPGIGQALNYLAWTHQFSLDFELCDLYSREALAIYQQIGHNRSMATTLNNMGFVARIKGEMQASLGYYDEAANIMLSIGEKRGYAYNLCGYAFSAVLMCQQSISNGKIEEALGILNQLDDKQLIAYALSIKALNECNNGNVQEALRLINLAEPLWANSGNAYGDIMCQIIQATCYLSLEEFAQVEFLLHKLKAAYNIDKSFVFWTNQLWERYHILVSQPKNMFSKAKDNLRNILKKNAGMLLPDELVLHAHLWAEKKNFQQGVVLFSFSEKLREALKLPVPPIWEPSHAQTRELLQTNMSDDEFEKLWQKGQSMTREELPAMLDLH